MLLEILEFFRQGSEALAQVDLSQVEIQMGIAPAVAAALIGAGGSILGGLLGGRGGGGGGTDPNLSRLSGAQAADVERRNQLLRFLEQVLMGGAEMPRGERPPIFQLPEDAGGPSLDPAFLEALQPAISPEFAALMQIAGLGLGTGGIQQAGSQAFQQDLLGQQRQSQIAQDLITLLLSEGFGQGNNSAAVANPGLGMGFGAARPVF